MTRLLGNSLAAEMIDAKKKLQDYIVNPVPYIGDWQEYSEPMEYTSANVMAISNTAVDLTKVFAISDPLRLRQGGDYKYFYVYSVTANTLSITGGTDFTFTAATITDLARGRKPNPTGFPFTFNYIAGYADPGSQLSSVNIVKSQFWMQGSTVTVDLHFDDGNLASGITSIYFLLPVIPANIYDVAFLPCVGLNNFRIQTAAIRIDGGTGTSFSGNTYYADAILIANPGTGGTGFDTWVTSTGGVGLDATFTYVVE